ncbi:nickel-dependent hydrogenase large subunit [Desulfobaculum bizertense]|uniref:hydrogenase large subunit n=1 Tax=Desulfobaculum bizertense TaxID=376490 RepID=UPI001F37BCC5|nr:nickel-dependent hydrogenase large subunit [Desulfobaculum bizertense]UIJ38382.1 nickel-dependent hydrogenase large subunit [Desulfobaculum bizertense]
MSTYSIPVGPLHVALEEPMYFRVEVEGETVKGLEVNAGHVHRGMESLAMQRNYFQNITLTERLCSLCSNSHPCTYCMAIENLAGIKVPERARYLRVMADEIKRVASNLFNVGIMAHIIGFESLFMHVMETRELAQDVKEGVYGNRMDLAANCIGGVKYDIDDDIETFLRTQLEAMKRPIEKIHKVYETDPLIIARTQGVGILPKEDALHMGVVGPVARASGVTCDIRVNAPYAAYEHLSFTLQTRTEADVQSRALVRLREVMDALSLIEQCLDQMTPGPLVPDYLPEIPEGQSVARSEAPRGELIYYLKSDGTDRPQRLKWRVPTYMNWEALHVMMKDCKVSDIPLIVNSIDPCISCTER